MQIRPSWDQTLMNMAIDVSKRSTCARLAVGAVLVKDKRVISMGYNGTPEGAEHCYDHFLNLFEKKYKNSHLDTFEEFKKTTVFSEIHYKWASENEIHAEMNAIFWAAKNGVSTGGTDLYVVYSPCIICSKTLLQAGIKRVFYHIDYDRETDKGKYFLTSNNVELIKIEY